MFSKLTTRLVLPLAAAAIAVPSLAAGSPTPVATEVRRPPITAEAPCSGAAEVELRLAHVDGANERDIYKVVVRDAKAESRWRLEIATYQGDEGSVGVYPTQRANRQGRWVLIDDAPQGFVEVVVTSTSRAGQACELELSGKVSSQ